MMPTTKPIGSRSHIHQSDPEGIAGCGITSFEEVGSEIKSCEVEVVGWTTTGAVGVGVAMMGGMGGTGVTITGGVTGHAFESNVSVDEYAVSSPLLFCPFTRT